MSNSNNVVDCQNHPLNCDQCCHNGLCDLTVNPEHEWDIPGDEGVGICESCGIPFYKGFCSTCEVDDYVNDQQTPSHIRPVSDAEKEFSIELARYKNIALRRDPLGYYKIIVDRESNNPLWMAKATDNDAQDMQDALRAFQLYIERT